MILLAADPSAQRTDAQAALERGGLPFRPHSFEDPTIPETIATKLLIVDSANAADAAIAFLRRWRTANDFPVLWLADSTAARRAGLLAGADAALIRPFEADEFRAIVQTILDRREERDRFALQVAESRQVHQTVTQFYEQFDADFRIARRVQRSCRPANLPNLETAKFAVSHRERMGSGGDFYDVARTDEDHVAFFLGDVMGSSLTATLLALFVHRAIAPKEISGKTYRLLPPDEVLRKINRELATLGMPDPPLVRLTYGLLNARTGSLAYGCAGHTPPLHLPPSGEPELWHNYGPMLGVMDGAYTVKTVQLTPGDRVLLFTDGLHGTTPETHAVLVRDATKHRGLPLPSLVECLTQDLLTQTPEPDDFTMLGLEFG